MVLAGSYLPSQADPTSEDSREVEAGAGPSQRPRNLTPSHTIFLCLQKSGLSEWLGDKLTPLQNVPPPAIAFIICLLIATFTECTSNVATTTLFLPILASMVSWSHRYTSSRQPFCPPYRGAPPAGQSETVCTSSHFREKTPELPPFPRLFSYLGSQGPLDPDSLHPW